MITKDIDYVAALLNENQVAAIPTETVYGLAANAFEDVPLKKIFDLKQRPYSNPLIVHIKSKEYLPVVAKNIPMIAQRLIDEFWPGPLTLILDKQNIVSSVATGGKNKVAIRMPNHPIAIKLLEQLDYPLAAPSANPFGSISPTKASHVEKYFANSIPAILDGGTCDAGLESTIIGFDNGRPILYRHGSITIAKIEEVVGKVTYFSSYSSEIVAPGMLSKHYSPKTKLLLVENVKAIIPYFKKCRIGLILYKERKTDDITIYQEILSPNGNLAEAASNLYDAMHRLDQKNLVIILAEKFPDIDLGKTINDRLDRAASK